MRKNSADLLDRLVQLHEGRKSLRSEEEPPSAGKSGAPSPPGIIGRMRRLVSGSRTDPGSPRPPEPASADPVEAESRAGGTGRLPAGTEREARDSLASSSRERASERPESENRQADAKSAALSGPEVSASAPPPWSLEAESLSFRRGFLKILNPGRSPRPGVRGDTPASRESREVEADPTRSSVARDDALRSAEAGGARVEVSPQKREESAPAEREAAAVLAGTEEPSLRGRLQPDEPPEPGGGEDPSSFEELARAASRSSSDIGPEEDASPARRGRPPGSSPPGGRVLGVLPGEPESYVPAHGDREAGTDSPEQDLEDDLEVSPSRARRSRRRRRRRGKRAADVFRQAAEASRQNRGEGGGADAAVDGDEQPSAAVEPQPGATIGGDQQPGHKPEPMDPARRGQEEPAADSPEAESVATGSSEPEAPLALELGARFPLSRRPPRPEEAATRPARARPAVRSRVSSLYGFAGRALSAVLGADVVRACRKPLEVSVATLTVAAAVGAVVVVLAVLATRRDDFVSGTEVSTGRSMPFSELNLPDIVPADNIRLAELRDVVVGSAGAAADASSTPPPATQDAAAPEDGRWYIQVQAFQDLTHPHFKLFVEYLNRLGYENIYKFPMGVIGERGQPYYYLRLGPYRDESEAKSQCDDFKRRASARPFGRGVDLETAFPRRLGPKTLGSRSRVRK